MANAARARKPWDLTDDETLTTFQNWQSIVLYNLSLDPNWVRFLPPDGVHKTWNKKSATHPNRGLVADGAPIPENDRKSATFKNTQLELMLGYISGYASVISRNSVVKTSTCLQDIWQQLREYYNFASTGAQFLELAAIKLMPDEKHERLFQRLTAFFDDNLLSVGCGIQHHGVDVTTDEEITPTVENTIVFLWLQLIHPGLPGLVKQKYGSELRQKTIASLKREISQALSSLLDELRSIDDTRVQRTATYQPRPSARRPNRPFKSCTLCKAAGRSGAQNHNLSECRFLPDGDRRALARSRAVIGADAPDHNEDIDGPSDDYDDALFDEPTACRVGIIQSPILVVHYGSHPVHLTLDTGATSTMIRSAFARKIGLPITPATQTARQADGRSTLTVIGETHFEVSRGRYTFQVDGLVVDELHNDVLAGTTFLVSNDIATRPAKNQIIIKGKDIIYYGAQHTKISATARRVTVQTALCRASNHTVAVMPGEFIEFSVPDKSDTTWALEPRMDCMVNHGVKLAKAWPTPQEIQSVAGIIRVVNTREDPILIRRHQHVCQVTPVVEVEDTGLPPSDICPDSTARVIIPGDTSQPYYTAVSLDPDNSLSQECKDKFTSLLSKYDDVFTPVVSLYNGASGDVKATVNMGPTLPPQRKGRLPHYNTATLRDLQDKFDDLERAGVFAKPEDVNITVEYLNTSFLVKKPSGGSRLVTAFGEVGAYSKPQPSLMPSVDKVLRDIAAWQYIIITDLLQSFYQIPLEHSSMKYCGVVTPYKGIRVYTRSAMGMPGSETCLEELMSRVLGELIMDGKVAKLADDLYIGGQTPEEALDNLSSVLDALQCNNLRLSARKTIICPKSAVILGWIWSAGTLKASSHKLSALSTVDPPKTVQGLRSFIGAYKVLSRVLPGYAQYTHSLDKTTAGRQSKEKIVWHDELLAQFKEAQAALLHTRAITLPTASDTLWIVTDGAVKSNGMGATMYVFRDNKTYLAGFFNAKLHKHQITWLPCEVEALCIAAAIKHFSPYIIQSSTTTQVLTDSRPCVQAYEKLNRGEFSNSARVTTFLSMVSRYQVHVSHIAGAANLPSDYTSRNAASCPDHNCQVCKFVFLMEDATVRGVCVKDIIEGAVRMPFTSRAAWYATQLECPDLRRSHAYLKNGTRPSKKATNIKDTKRYIKVLTLSNDGMLVYRDELPFHQVRERIAVPRPVLDGLLTALHIRLDHPAQSQLKQVFTRYFYALDLDKALSLVSANCHHCVSLRSFPPYLQPQSSVQPPDVLGCSFAADVMRRYRQHILVIRETVSSYTRTMIIADEQHGTLRDALLILCSDFKSPGDGIIHIRVDAAPAFQHLATDTTLTQKGITLVLGHVKNVNKNPVAEKAIQELGLECLRLRPEGGPMSHVTLALTTARMNSRIRTNGLSAVEMWTQRDQLTGEQLAISDRDLILQQQRSRQNNQPSSAKSKSHGKCDHTHELHVGDLVYIKGEKDKTKSRDKYLVVEVDGQRCKVRKFTSSQFRSRTYELKVGDCYPIYSTVLGRSWQGPVRGLDPDTVSESDFTDGSESDHEPVQSHGPEPVDPEPPDHTHPSPALDTQPTIPPADLVQVPSPALSSHLEDTTKLPIKKSCQKGVRSKSGRKTAPPAWMDKNQWELDW